MTDSAEKMELKPCPFCDGQCKVHTSGNKSSSHWFNVYCLRCNAQNQQCQSPIDAITAWNTRKISPLILNKMKVISGVCAHVSEQHRSDIPIEAHSFCEFLRVQKSRVDEVIEAIGGVA